MQNFKVIDFKSIFKSRVHLPKASCLISVHLIQFGSFVRVLYSIIPSVHYIYFSNVYICCCCESLSKLKRHFRYQSFQIGSFETDSCPNNQEFAHMDQNWLSSVQLIFQNHPRFSPLEIL